ncbi:thioredoxin domain-containing protein [Eupeodes corollae]|uniref:thioredoxin domain-containing protein n=1 Tax=Eupeodes corollae TaxID=290404 RepID=UPI00248FDBD6|nr:thioredoxin domain-containing protein [Eupeodes corollae]XP_055908154.1 thioredoxin domain-containing protein [Eupeodes corollae]
MKFIPVVFCISFLLIGSTSSVEIEAVDDSDLVHLITGEDNVIALFTKANCESCDELETVVENIQDDLKTHLSAVVVKSMNSHMTGIYNPSKEPALVYFRRGLPLLYHGPITEDDIMHTFSENRDPVVKELSDNNFEHLTQAATGATTGDWFVFFYSNDCVVCQRLYAVWEAVGAALKRRMNVARINRLEYGISTARRFNVRESPEFLFIRQGKYFRYRLKEYTPSSFIDFAQNIHLQKTKPEAVPPLSSPIDDFLNDNVKSILGHPQLYSYGIVGIAVLALAVFLCKCVCSKKSKTTAEKKKAK